MILIHYGEIGLKGKNRIKFENLLVKNIRRILNEEVVKISREHGRILVFEKENADYELLRKKLKKLPGIENFSFAVQTPCNIDEIKKNSLKLIKEEDFKSFKVHAKRGNKSFPLTSIQINEMVGKEIKNKMKKEVNLNNPEITIYIEIGKENAYIYKEKISGIGGLPTGMQGKVISLLSGGIDSPVASWMMIKRGCNVIFLHFYNETIVSYPKKIEEIIQLLTETQIESKAYFVRIGDFQREVIKSVPAKYRMLMYRRFMNKIANEIAKKEKAKGIVTGDSIGQVASQTLDNIICIYSSSNFPVFSPLIGLDKKEIINIAKKIGTYEISIKPYDDCCSFMVAKHPVIKARIEEIEKMEKRVYFSPEEILEKAEIKKFVI
ncbi:MAG TPA: tRNA 4-thiouridine(8) synthase ThiI [Thermoplasmatales archaeon]|nr:tRNA 4-thiouridine(8) synthase ThiI [Thermoplasmatales archaeon]